MALVDLKDPASVLSAIAEYDKLGREEFLSKYGFGEAREYFLVHQGKRYDSKAILGVAHGFEFPSLGRLKSEDFHGGAETVKKLESLGFDVISDSFQATPCRRSD